MGQENADFKITVSADNLKTVSEQLKEIETSLSKINAMSGKGTTTPNNILNSPTGGGAGDNAKRIREIKSINDVLDSNIRKEKEKNDAYKNNDAVRNQVKELNNLKNANKELTDQITGGNAKQKESNDLMEVAIGKIIRYRVAFYAMAEAVQMFKNMMNEAIQFNTTMTDLQVVLNTTESNLKTIGNELYNMASKFGTSSKDVGEGMKVWAQAGYEVNDMLKLTQASLLASNVTGLSAAESTDALISAVETYGVEINNVTSVVDKWMKVQAKYPVSAQDLANAMKTIGEQAQLVGVDVDDLMGYITAINETTRKSGKAIALSLKSIFAGIVSDEAVKKFQDLGIAVYATENTYRDLDNVLLDLSKKWDTLSNTQKTNLALTLGGKYRYADFIALMDNFKTKIKAGTDAQTSAGEAQKANEIVMKSFQKQLESLNAEWGNLGRAIGGGILIPLTELMRDLRFFAELLNKIPEEVKTFTGLIVSLGIAFAGVKTAIWLAKTGFVMVREQMKATAVVAGVTATAVNKTATSMKLLAKSNLISLGITAGVELLIWLLGDLKRASDESTKSHELWVNAWTKGTNIEKLAAVKDQIAKTKEEIKKLQSESPKDLRKPQMLGDIYETGESPKIRAYKKNLEKLYALENELNKKIATKKPKDSKYNKKDETGSKSQYDTYKQSMDLLVLDLLKIDSEIASGLDNIKQTKEMYEILGQTYDSHTPRLNLLISSYDKVNEAISSNRKEMLLSLETIKTFQNRIEETTGKTPMAFTGYADVISGKTDKKDFYEKNKLSAEQRTYFDELIKAEQTYSNYLWQINDAEEKALTIKKRIFPLLKEETAIATKLYELQTRISERQIETDSDIEMRMNLLRASESIEEKIMLLEMKRNNYQINSLRLELNERTLLNNLDEEERKKIEQQIGLLEIKNRELKFGVEIQQNLERTINATNLRKAMSSSLFTAFGEIPKNSYKSDKARAVKELQLELSQAKAEYENEVKSGKTDNLVDIKNKISDINYEMRQLTDTTYIWRDALDNISGTYIQQMQEQFSKGIMGEGGFLDNFTKLIYGVDSKGTKLNEKELKGIAELQGKIFRESIISGAIIAGNIMGAAIGGGGKWASTGSALGASAGGIAGRMIDPTGIIGGTAGSAIGGIAGGLIGGLFDTEEPLHDFNNSLKKATDNLNNLSKTQPPIYQVKIGVELGKGTSIEDIVDNPVAVRKLSKIFQDEGYRLKQSTGHRMTSN